MDNKNYEHLPKIEVSFQDDFSGGRRELITTPSCVLRMLTEKNIQPHIGDKVLVWEEDVDNLSRVYYLCNLGEWVEVQQDVSREYSYENIPLNDFITVDDCPAMLLIDKNNYFNVYGEKWK